MWATESTSTGEATPTVVSETPLGGYDCPSTSDTLYAVSTAEVLRGTAQPSALVPGVGTVNTATGVYSETAALSDPEANVIALGVTPIAPPPRRRGQGRRGRSRLHRLTHRTT